MGYEDTLRFIKDGNKFLQNFAGMIDESIPHLYLSALPFAPCKSILATSLVSQFPKIAQVAVGQCEDWPTNQLVLQGHTSSVNSVAFSPDGRHIVSGSWDQTIQVWDAQTGGQVGTPLQGHTDSVNSVAFSPDGRHIVSGSSDETIRVWDAQTACGCNLLRGHIGSVNSVAFSPDGRYIVSGSLDRTIRVWDTQTGSQVGNSLQGHTDSIYSVAFSSDGRHIVSGSLDQTIQVWDVWTGMIWVGNIPQEHPQSLVNLGAVPPDGKHTVSSSDENVICTWDEKGSSQMASFQEHAYFQAVSTTPLIYFSSAVAHALQNPQSLFFDTNLRGDWRDFIQLQKDGWIVGPNGKLLLWVPPSYHTKLGLYFSWTGFIPRGIPKLDLSKMVHGTDWHECYLPK